MGQPPSPMAPPRLVADLGALGLRDGDTVLVRAALRSMGSWEPNNGAALIASLREVVGPTGTIMCLAHSGVGRRRASPTHFTPSSPAIIGGLANMVLQTPGAVRSSHPTHSFVAVGADAARLAAAHTERDACFGFVGELIERDALMMLVGCTESGPGFSTVDFAQLELGLVHRTRRRPGLGAYYTGADGAEHWFERTDEPGCSRGFGNLYRHYLRAGVLHAGDVGSAYSLAGRSAALYAVDRQVIEADPTASLCDDPLCVSCRFQRTYNNRDVPGYVARRAVHLARRLPARLRRG